MSGAFLALWNDFPNAMTEEYETWHTFEHVPERLTASGMRAAVRYASFDAAGNRYFTLYEMDDLQTVEHPSYMDLVRNPTAWSAKMRLHFSNVLRIPAQTLARHGRGLGCCAIVQAYAVERDHARSSGLELAKKLADLVERGTILGYSVGMAEPNQPYEVFQQGADTDADTYNIVLVIDGRSRETLQRSLSIIGELAASTLQPRQLLRDDLLDLVVAFPQPIATGDRAAVAASAQLREKFAV